MNKFLITMLSVATFASMQAMQNAQTALAKLDAKCSHYYIEAQRGSISSELIQDMQESISQLEKYPHQNRYLQEILKATTSRLKDARMNAEDAKIAFERTEKETFDGHINALKYHVAFAKGLIKAMDTIREADERAFKACTDLKIIT